MILKSFSKINLSLRINKKLKNGLHDIQSYFCLINLYDKILIKKTKGKKDKVKFVGEFANDVKIKNNSVLKVLSLLRKNKILSNYYSIIVQKKIPVFAGLGGGTSNAYSLFQYFNKGKFKKDLNNMFFKEIGSDFELFKHKQAFLENLNVVNNFKKQFKLNFLLVYPYIKCSTKMIYSKVDKYSLKSKLNSKNLKNKKKFIKFLSLNRNDLQQIVEKKAPIVKELTSELAQKEGCYFSRLTGSGSVCFGLFSSKRSARAALYEMKLKYPKFWFIVTKTI